MSALRPISLALVLLGLLAGLWSAVAQEASRRGTLLTLDGPVTPASAGYLAREISAANLRGDHMILLEMNTPGGLVTSMEEMVQAIRASETPVVTFVAPQGARSLSAGFYVMYASHLSAMAPSTTTGAATPVSLGGDPGGPAPEPAPGEAGEESGDGATPAPRDDSSEASLRRKVIESSVAYIRGLATATGRDVEFAEAAVRDGDSITAREALARGVIEIVAADRADLLEQLNGQEVTTRAGPVVLDTEGLDLIAEDPPLFERILGFFADPNVAAILLSLGTLGITVELWNPGSIFPGAFGAVCLLLAFYSFSVLPFEGLYLALMALGAVLLIVEAFTPTFGLAGSLGLAALGAGLYFVFPDAYRVSPALIAVLILSMGALLGLILLAFMRSRSHGPLIGGEAIRRREGRVESWAEGAGWVIVDGERWRARAKEPLAPGEKIKVADVDGLVLIVRRAAARTLRGRT